MDMDMYIIIFLFLAIFVLSCVLLCLVISDDAPSDKDAMQKKTEALLREMNQKTFKAQKEMICEALRSLES